MPQPTPSAHCLPYIKPCSRGHTHTCSGHGVCEADTSFVPDTIAAHSIGRRRTLAQALSKRCRRWRGCCKSEQPQITRPRCALLPQPLANATFEQAAPSSCVPRGRPPQNGSASVVWRRRVPVSRVRVPCMSRVRYLMLKLPHAKTECEHPNRHKVCDN